MRHDSSPNESHYKNSNYDMEEIVYGTNILKGENRPVGHVMISLYEDFIKKPCLEVMLNLWFDRFMLLVIALNTIFLAMEDYSHVDSQNNLVSDGSTVNLVIISSDIAFTVIFVVEFGIKAVAMGIVYGEFTYFTDRWNWLDFSIVILALLSNLPNVPNLKFLRAFRALRPLKALKSLPGVAAVIKMVLRSMPMLLDMAIAITFFLFVFSIIGLQVYCGPFMHARCRLTPFPVLNNWTAGFNYSDFRCLQEPNFNYPAELPALTKSSSPWSTPQPECYWPLDTNDIRGCSLSGIGLYTCNNPDYSLVPSNPANDSSLRWCGSNYDAMGNPRFDASTADEELQNVNFEYGYLLYDNIGFATLYVLQIISENNWSQIMYNMMDAIDPITPPLFAVAIILLGFVVLLQLNIGILQNVLVAEKTAQLKKKYFKKTKRMRMIETLKRSQMIPSGDSEDTAMARIEKINMSRRNSDFSAPGWIEDEEGVRDGSEPSKGDGNFDAELSRQSEATDHSLAAVPTITDLPVEPLISKSPFTITKIKSKKKMPRKIISHNPGKSPLNGSIEMTAPSKMAEQEADNDNEKDPVISDGDKEDALQPTSLHPPAPLLSVSSVKSVSFRFDTSDGEESKKKEPPRPKKKTPTALFPQKSNKSIWLASGGASLDQRPDESTNTNANDKNLSLHNTESTNEIDEEDEELDGKSRDEASDSYMTTWTYSDSAIRKFVLFIETWDRPNDNPFRVMCKKFSNLRVFVWTFNFMIIFNAVILAQDRHPIDDTSANVFTAMNYILTFLFAFETAVRLLGLGLINYFSDHMNTFDLCIVILSMVDACTSPIPYYFSSSAAFSDITNPSPSKNAGLNGNFSSLRAFRLFRLLRLMNGILSFKALAAKIIKVVYAMESFLWLLCMYVLIYALLGMQFFANRFRFDANGNAISVIHSNAWNTAPDQPMPNFDNFLLSIASIFSILTLDNWTVIFYNCGRVYGPAALLFPLSCFVIGSYFFLNMFLAMLVYEYSESEITQTLTNQILHVKNNKEMIEQRLNADQQPRKDLYTVESGSDKSDFKKDPSRRLFSDDIEASLKSSGESEWNAHEDQSHMVSKSNEAAEESQLMMSDRIVVQDCRSSDSLLNTREESSNAFSDENIRAKDDRKERLGSFQKKILSLRAVCSTIVSDPLFNGTILVIILAASIISALDNPLKNPNSSVSTGFYYFDLFALAVFLLEMVLKMISLGLIENDRSYFRVGWNQLDFFIVCVSVISIIAISNNLQSLKSLRALRALRPLRLIQRFSGLRAITSALFLSVPVVSQILLINIFLFFVVAVFFTSFQKGQLRSCSGPVYFNLIGNISLPYNQLLLYPKPFSSMTPIEQSWFGPNSPVNPSYNLSESCLMNWPFQPCCPQLNLFENQLTADDPTSRDICECWGGQWTALSSMLFDNSGLSLLNVYEASTFDNWVNMVSLAAQTTGIDMQPIVNYSIWWYYLYVLFIIIVGLLFLQLFVGAICASFEDTKASMGGYTFLTKEQQEWVMTRKIILAITPKKKPLRPSNTIRAIAFDICTHPHFDKVIFAAIIIQCAQLSALSFGQSDVISNVLQDLYIALTGIFFFEMVLKLLALSLRVYFDDSWNCFDFILVLGSSVTILINQFETINVPFIVTLGRVFRVIRAVRLLKGLDGLQRLINTIILVLPGLANISFLLFLIISIFTVIAVDLFAKTAYYNTYYNDANFRSFGIGFLTLFRIATLDNWGQFMWDLSQKTPDCVVDPPYNASYCGFQDSSTCLPLNGCGSVGSFPFLILFTFVVAIILLNLFIGIIITNYNNVVNSPIHPEDFEAFAQHWMEFDPNASCYIPLNKLYIFTLTLFEPLGFGGQPCTRRQYVRRVGRIKVMPDQRVHFHDVITSLSVAHFERLVSWKENIRFEWKPMKSLSEKSVNSSRDRLDDMSTVGGDSVKTQSFFVMGSIRNRLSASYRRMTLNSRKAFMHELHFGEKGKVCHTVSEYLAAELIKQVWEIRKLAILEERARHNLHMNLLYQENRSNPLVARCEGIKEEGSQVDEGDEESNQQNLLTGRELLLSHPPPSKTVEPPLPGPFNRTSSATSASSFMSGLTFRSDSESSYSKLETSDGETRGKTASPDSMTSAEDHMKALQLIQAKKKHLMQRRQSFTAHNDIIILKDHANNQSKFVQRVRESSVDEGGSSNGTEDRSGSKAFVIHQDLTPQPSTHRTAASGVKLTKKRKNSTKASLADIQQIDAMVEQQRRSNVQQQQPSSDEEGPSHLSAAIFQRNNSFSSLPSPSPHLPLPSQSKTTKPSTAPDESLLKEVEASGGGGGGGSDPSMMMLTGLPKTSSSNSLSLNKMIRQSASKLGIVPASPRNAVVPSAVDEAAAAAAVGGGVHEEPSLGSSESYHGSVNSNATGKTIENSHHSKGAGGVVVDSIPLSDRAVDPIIRSKIKARKLVHRISPLTPIDPDRSSEVPLTYSIDPRNEHPIQPASSNVRPDSASRRNEVKHIEDFFLEVQHQTLPTTLGAVTGGGKEVLDSEGSMDDRPSVLRTFRSPSSLERLKSGKLKEVVAVFEPNAPPSTSTSQSNRFTKPRQIQSSLSMLSSTSNNSGWSNSQSFHHVPFPSVAVEPFIDVSHNNSSSIQFPLLDPTNGSPNGSPNATLPMPFPSTRNSLRGKKVVIKRL